MTKAREAIARALDDPMLVQQGQHNRMQQADALIAALLAAGLRIVPEEPDEAMLMARQDPVFEQGTCVNLTTGEKTHYSSAVQIQPSHAAKIYRAMISAYEDGK